MVLGTSDAHKRDRGRDGRCPVGTKVGGEFDDDDDVSRSLLAELHARNPALPTLMLSTFAELTTKIPKNAVRLVAPLTLDTLERAIEVMSREMRSPIGRS